MLWRTAMTLTRGASVTMLRRMLSRGIGWEEFFSLPDTGLYARMVVNPGTLPDETTRKKAVEEARNRLSSLRQGQRVIGYGDKGYPRRLAQCPDAPMALFVEGDADLDADRMISMVGTRKCNEIGHAFVEKALKELTDRGIRPTVVSGLAYGIDTAAHKQALVNGLPTVAVVAHGLDTIYPSGNSRLARDIVKAGGAIVSEYPPITRPYRQRFLERNRIIAGLCDLTLVVQSDVRGGAMSTARCSQEYNRETGAVPGRFSDEMSQGCHRLIRIQRATLISSAADICETMKWKADPGNQKEAEGTPSLFAEVSKESVQLYTLLKEATDPLPMEVLQEQSGLRIDEVMSLIGELEFEGMVRTLPGNRFMAVK